jgi:integrase
MGKLTATAVKAAKAPGRYGDGDGLHLLVSASGSQSWVVRVQKDGKRRDIGLGSATKVSLADARKRASQVRSQVEAGLDPITERRKQAGIPTFRAAAAEVYAEQRGAWRAGKHVSQWLRSLEMHAFPALGDISVALITDGQVRDVLAAIWLTKSETARRVRQRIGQVLDWAVAKGYRDSGVAWGVVNKALPKMRRTVKHHEAMPYSDVTGFLKALKATEPTFSKLALEFAILTAARSGEVRGAVWSEIDLEKGLWSLPPERMPKGKRPHVVPLSPQARDVLARARAMAHALGPSGSEGFVFPGEKAGKTLSDNTLRKLMRDRGLISVPHGFRSTFRDWVGNETNFGADTAELAIAHAVANPVEAAYARGDQLQKRTLMMNAWGAFVAGEAAPALRLVSA